MARETYAVRILRLAGKDYVSNLVMRAKQDYLGLTDEEQVYLDALTTIIYDIEKLKRSLDKEAICHRKGGSSRRENNEGVKNK